MLLLLLLRKEVISPLAGLISGAGEKLVVPKVAALCGVTPETDTANGCENLSECLVKSFTYSKSSIRATMLKAMLSKTLE